MDAYTLYVGDLLSGQILGAAPINAADYACHGCARGLVLTIVLQLPPFAAFGRRALSPPFLVRPYIVVSCRPVRGIESDSHG
jgi:hypothetical protein